MYHQQPSTRRHKKRHIQGIKTVEVSRGKSGYGFTISGQNPCILSCIVSDSPADRCGLKTGDYLMAVNGLNISKSPHDDVVRLIGSSSGLLVLQITEKGDNSDTSEEEFQGGKAKVRPTSRARFKGNQRVLSAIDRDRRVNHRHGDSNHKHNGFQSTSQSSEDRSHDTDPRLHTPHSDMMLSHSGGSENINPALSAGVYPRRRKPMPTSAGGHGVSKGSHVKHTIITREARMGRSAGGDMMNQYLHDFSHSGGSQIPRHDPRHGGYPAHHGYSGHQYPSHHQNYRPHSNYTVSSSSSNSTASMTPQDLSNILFPSLQPHVNDRRADRYMRDMIDHSADLDDGVEPDVTVIVAYIGSIEMPSEANLPGSHQLQSIRSAVRRLRFEHKVHTLVLMHIFIGGIKLSNSRGVLMAHYPAEKIAFSGLCPDDHRFFGIVTLHGIDAENVCPKKPNAPSSSCHVFMVDPDLAVHAIHAQKARSFGIHCTVHSQSQECLEFPIHAKTVLHSVAKLYGHRQNEFCRNDGDPQGGVLGPSDSSITTSSSSNSDSGLGFRDDQVYVVEMDQSDAAPPRSHDHDHMAGLANHNLADSNLSTTNGTFDQSHWEDDEEVSSAFTPIRPYQHSCSSFLTGPDISTSSAETQGGSHLLSEKLNVRAMPDPEGLTTDQLQHHEQQNSAHNLRKSAHRIMQSRQQQWHSGYTGSDAESLRSNDSSVGHPNTHDRENSTGSSRTESSRTESSRTESEVNVGDNDNRPPTPDRKHKPGNQSKFESHAGIGGMGSRRAIPVPIPIPPSPVNETPSHKPPLPERRPILHRRHPRTPAPLPRKNRPMDRPKSTPPRPPRYGASPVPMDDDYDSDPGSVYAGSSAKHDMPSDLHMEVDDWSGHIPEHPDDESLRESLRQSPANKQRYSEGFILLKQRQDDRASSKLHKTGSFKFLDKLRKKATPISNSHESLVVSDVEFTKSAKLGGATSAVALSSEVNNTTPCNNNSIHTVVADDVCDTEVVKTTAASWAVSFDKLLADDHGVEKFTEFLKKEFSEENIVFWLECESYKAITDDEKRKCKAKEIFNTHVSPQASDPVNVDSHAQKNTAQALEQAKCTLFDVAQKQIWQLMKTDSYPRFLKSTLYKECVVSDLDTHSVTTANKQQPTVKSTSQLNTTVSDSGGKMDRKSMKKVRSSVSNHDDDDKRRKSLNILPWTRNKSMKNLSKSTVDIDSSVRQQQQADTDRLSATTTGPHLGHLPPSGPLAHVRTSDSSHLTAAGEKKRNLFRVFFPDGSTTVNHVRSGVTTRAALYDLCTKRNVNLASTDVLYSGSEKVVDLSKDCSTLGGKEIVIEHRVLFRVDLPNRKSIGVKAKPSRTVKDVFKPILNKYGFKMDGMQVFLINKGTVVDIEKPVSTIENQHVSVQNSLDFAGKKSKTKEWGGFNSHRTGGSGKQSKSTADSLNGITNQVFKDLMQGKEMQQFDELGILDPDRKIDERFRGDDHRNSGLFSFIRRNSIGEKEAMRKGSKLMHAQPSEHVPHPARRTRYKDPEEDRFIELLTRVQSHRLDEQRGLTAKDLELPDFLKVATPPQHSSKFVGNHGDESICSSSSSNRKRERRNSDSSMLDFMADPKQRCSLSQEALDLNSSTYSLHTAIPYSNRSFSQDGIVPAHHEAEMYFSSQVDGFSAADPNFNDSHIMDKSLGDIGIVQQNINSYNAMHLPPRQSKPKDMNVRSSVYDRSSFQASRLNSTTPTKLSPRAKNRDNMLDSSSCMPPPPPEFMGANDRLGVVDCAPPTSFATAETTTTQHRAPLKDTINTQNGGKTNPPNHLHIRSKSDVTRTSVEPDSTTPSPTTHDLIFDPQSSPELPSAHVRHASDRTHKAKKSLMFNIEQPIKTKDNEDDMQVSFV